MEWFFAGVFVVLAFGFLWGTVTAFIGYRNNYPVGSSFVWGFFLGLIGLIVVVMRKPLPAADRETVSPLLTGWVAGAYGVAILAGLWASWPARWWPWPQLFG